MEDVFPTEIVPNLRGHVRFRGEVNKILMLKKQHQQKQRSGCFRRTGDNELRGEVDL